MQRLMLLLLLLLREQPPFLEIWATGAGELGQLLFLNCPSEQRGQPRTAAAHGPCRSLEKDLRGPVLLSAAQCWPVGQSIPGQASVTPGSCAATGSLPGAALPSCQLLK